MLFFFCTFLLKTFKRKICKACIQSESTAPFIFTRTCWCSLNCFSCKRMTLLMKNALLVYLQKKVSCSSQDHNGISSSLFNILLGCILVGCIYQLISGDRINSSDFFNAEKISTRDKIHFFWDAENPE